jgi:hypothetical protein
VELADTSQNAGHHVWPTAASTTARIDAVGIAAGVHTGNAAGDEAMPGTDAMGAAPTLEAVAAGVAPSAAAMLEAATAGMAGDAVAP